MYFETEKAKEIFKEITEIHRVEINAPPEMILTEKTAVDMLLRIYRQNYKDKLVRVTINPDEWKGEE